MPINSFLYPGAKTTPAYEVANSCRFEDGDSPKMTITQGNPTEPGGNASRKWTISTWVKRGNLGIDSYIFLGGAYTNQGNKLYFDSNDNLVYWEHNSSSTTSWKFVTNRKFRDCSAWYSIIVAHDSTQSTEGNRVKIYINGTQETSFSTDTYPSEDADSNFMYNAEVITIGAQHTQNYLDGYLAETVFIDGSQLAATSFGEFDEDSPTIWKPKDVSGLTFGNNGFYLDFEDSSNLGNDANGGTDLSETNLAAADQATDTPTNSFATLNPIFKTGAWSSSTGTVTLSEGNCHLAEGTHAVTCGTIAIPNGKWYFEFKPNGSDYMFGVTGTEPAGNNAYSYYDSTSYGIYVESSGGWWITGGSKVNQSTYTGTGTYMIAIDVDNQKLWFGEGGTWTGDPAAGSGNSITLGTHLYIPWFHSAGTAGDNSANVNFGGCPAFSISSGNADANGYGNFEYSVPSGFYALCTKNLAEFG